MLSNKPPKPRPCKQCGELTTNRPMFCDFQCKNKHDAEKKKNKPKKKTKSATTIKSKSADKYFSLCIRMAAGWNCEKCGRNFEHKKGTLHCSHVFSRKHRTIRWAKENAKALCFSCHRDWHDSPTEAYLWFIGWKGQEFYDLLVEKKQNKVKVTKLEEIEIAEHYKKESKKLELGATDFISYQ